MDVQTFTNEKATPHSNNHCSRWTDCCATQYNFKTYFMSNYRYVWLNINTGEFSDSWDEETHQKAFSPALNGEKLLSDAKERGGKLIKYECLNDEDFEFYNKMKLR